MQQEFSRIAPQHPKNDITNIIQPSIIIMMGSASTLTASSNDEKSPRLPIISEPRMMMSTPHTYE